MKVLVLPISGKSSRYPDVRPKWLLVHPNRNLMICESIKGIKPNLFDKILIIGLEQYDKQYRFANSMKKEMEKYNKNVQIILLKKETTSQPETVALGLKKAKLDKDNISIFIKDCDNYFEIKSIPDSNTVCVGDLNEHSTIKAYNKSYVSLGIRKTVANIVEKEVIGNLFCCGGYYFSSAKEFCDVYETIKMPINFYISHIIYYLIIQKKVFFTEQATNYIDWGTLEEWNEYTKKFDTLFVDIDGTLLENSSKFFYPFRKYAKPIQNNINFIREKYLSGYSYIIITTARDEKERKFTEEQLKNVGIKYHKLIMGLPHCKRIVINDYSNSNGYPSAIGINLVRNADNLKDMV